MCPNLAASRRRPPPHASVSFDELASRWTHPLLFRLTLHTTMTSLSVWLAAALCVALAPSANAYLFAGRACTCGVKIDGTAECWGAAFLLLACHAHTPRVRSTSGALSMRAGQNTFGQLGDNTQFDRASPVVAQPGRKYASIVCADSHSCGLKSDGTAECWGASGACRTAFPAMSVLACGPKHCAKPPCRVQRKWAARRWQQHTFVVSCGCCGGPYIHVHRRWLRPHVWSQDRRDREVLGCACLEGRQTFLASASCSYTPANLDCVQGSTRMASWGMAPFPPPPGPP